MFVLVIVVFDFYFFVSEIFVEGMVEVRVRIRLGRVLDLKRV